MGLLPCESIGTTPGIPFPGFVPSLSGGLLGHFLALTGPKYGAKRDLAWVRPRGLHPMLSWHLATAPADVLPFRLQLPSLLELPWLQLLGSQSQT